MSDLSSSIPERDVAKIFHHFDSNGDGKISASELLSLLRSLGSPDASPDHVQKMMDEMDSDRDGFVDLDEFSAFFSRHGGDAHDEDVQLRDAFNMYDLNGNGRISAKELHLVMSRLGDGCSVEDCAKMIRSVDEDGDGCVDFGEFKRMMTSGVPKKV